MLCRPAHISITIEGRKNSSAAKKDRLEWVKSRWKRSEIYLFSRSLTQNFLHWPNMVTDIFEDFELPSKNFLATPLSLFLRYKKSCKKAIKLGIFLPYSVHIFLGYDSCFWKNSLRISWNHIMKNFQLKHGQCDSIFPKNIFFWRL